MLVPALACASSAQDGDKVGQSGVDPVQFSPQEQSTSFEDFFEFLLPMHSVRRHLWEGAREILAVKG